MDFLDIAFADPPAIRADEEANPAPSFEMRSKESTQEPRKAPSRPYRAPAAPTIALAYGVAWKRRTVKGRPILCGIPTAAFWQAWRHRKDAMKAAGYSVRPFGRDWECTNWNGEAIEVA